MTTWTKVTGDFDFLNGYFDVRHRQLTQALTGSDEWIEYDGTSTARTYFDGQISIDEMRFPTKGTYGLSLRLFDPVSEQWSIWWVNSTTMKLYPPVHGGWTADGTSCRLVGEDTHEGRPILCSYEWSAITDESAHWEQAYSADDGKTWETNWTMDFTRRATPPPALDVPKITDDFDFLVGRWSFHNRRRRPALGEPFEWYEHDATMEATTYFDGAISFDEGWFPSENFRGATFRLYDPQSRSWSIHWINSTRGHLETPVVGTFTKASAPSKAPTPGTNTPSTSASSGPPAPTKPPGNRPSPPTTAKPGPPTGKCNTPASTNPTPHHAAATFVAPLLRRTRYVSSHPPTGWRRQIAGYRRRATAWRRPVP